MRKSTFRAIIAFLLIAVFLVCGWLIGWQVTGEINPSQWGKPKDDNDNQTNVIITEGGSHGATILCAEIPVSDFAAYNLDEEETESAFTLTLSVTPETAVVTNFTWSAEFVNSNSEWAQGKDINDYYTLTPAEDNRSAVAACKQAFGEQIRIKAVYDGDVTIYATKMADYVKRIVGINLKYNSIACIYEPCTSSDLEPFSDCQFVYGVGTVQGTYAYQNSTAYLWFELSDDAYNYLTSSTSTSYQYMSNFFAANAGYGIKKETTHKNFSYDENDGWDILHECDGSELISGYNWQTVKNYSSYAAALREMVEHTTNQLRVAIQVTYKYGDSFSEDITVYSDWVTTPVSNIELISGIVIPGNDLIH